MIVNINLAALGVFPDLTTQGVKDSAQTMSYMEECL